MGRLEGKVVVISGAARGQGRSHAVTFAREGASVVAFDICEQLPSVLTPGATEEDLAETQRLVEEQDRRCITAKADARDLPALQALADSTIAEFGRLDFLLVNHGLWSVAPNTWELEEDAWQETIDIMVTGSWKTVKAFVPRIIESGNGGSVVFTSSANGLTVQPGAVAYNTAKAGILHMMRTLAWEAGRHKIRSNAVCPGGIQTAMLLEGGTVERSSELNPEYFALDRNRLDIGGWQPIDSISNAMLFLCSDEGAYVTGVALPVDSGWSIY